MKCGIEMKIRAENDDDIEILWMRFYGVDSRNG